MPIAQCPYCSSTQVKIVHSEENRDVMVIQCLSCGRQSSADTENDQTDPGDLSPPTDAGAPSPGQS